MDKKVFSDYYITKATVKFEDETKSVGNIIAQVLGSIGTLEESMDSRIVTKNFEGVEETVSVKGTGTGELKVTAHVREDVFKKAYGMELEALKDGVYAYGKNSKHKYFCFTAEVQDEYERVKYRAYPRCIITDGIARKTENGADEVAQVEFTIKVTPDEKGNGLYEATLEELQDATLKQIWIEKFNIADVYEEAA